MLFLRSASLMQISIHALREEGDVWLAAADSHGAISIHALREEGDARKGIRFCGLILFLSTPSARRATVGGGKTGCG